MLDKKFHEKAVVKAVLSVFNKKNSSVLSIGVSPDQDERKQKAVDFVINEGKDIFGFAEHTLIESYPDQLQDGQNFLKLLGPLEARLSGNLPLPGHYQLSIEIGILKGVKVKKIDKIRDKIESWVYAKAPSLAVGSPQTTPRHCVSEIFQDIPFKITLYRWEPLSPARDGKLSISRFMTNDLENKRQDRIKKAINKKCPKLLAAKNQGNGFKSVLILESNDLALANFSFIGKAFIKEIINCDNEVPDFVYLVETGISPWVVWILKDRLRNFPNISDMGPYYV